MSRETTAQVATATSHDQPANGKRDHDRANGMPPPLQAGDFLTRAEFERRYHRHPNLKKAELIEGIVYMPSPVNAAYHGNPHFDLIGWLALYRASVPGLFGSDNATLRLDNINDPQPDALLYLDAAHGGRVRLDADGYLEGPVEFVLEVAASTASYDMNQKKATYARHGILEYLVVLTHERRVVWYGLRDGSYAELAPDVAGIIHSEVFPGLWLNVPALWARDLAALLTTVQQGIATAEHQAYIESLQRKPG